MKYFDTFTGIGGFTLAINKAYVQKLYDKYGFCGNIEICKKCVQDAKKKNLLTSSIARLQTQPNAKSVPESMPEEGLVKTQKSLEKQVENVEKKTEKNITEKEENTIKKDDKQCWICMGVNVLAVESLLMSFSHLNISDRTVIKIEKSTEQDITINLLSRKTTNQNMKSFATIATMLEEDMEGVPTCVGFSEIDKYAVEIYNKHFNHTNFHDITKINAKELPDFELLVGGFPCPSWSIAGKRGGFEDLRGQLVFDIIRILRGKKPRMFVLENVKGILSHDKGNSMEVICEALCESGYAIDFEVLNSKDFGVPQNRERVFIIGKRLDTLPKGAIY